MQGTPAWHVSTEEAIAVVHQQTNVSLQPDDPVLAVTSVLNLFGDNLNELLQAERAALKGQIKADVSVANTAINKTIAEVSDQLETVAKNLGNEAIQTLIDTVTRHAVDTDRIRRALRNSTYALSLLALANWFAVAAFYFILK